MARILRGLQYLNESDTNQDWSKKIQAVLQEAIHEQNQSPEKIIDSKPWLTQLNASLKQNLTYLKNDLERLRKGLIKCRYYIFGFGENPVIPAINNGAERGIRKLKVKQKTKGTFRSDTLEQTHSCHYAP